VICDPAGKPLGAVQSVLRPDGSSGDGRGIRWSKLPPAPVGPNTAAASAPGEDDIPNPHLRGFVGGLLQLAVGGKCTSSAFEDFLNLLTELEDTEPRPSGEPGSGVFYGRPLVLARASLALDLRGPPALDPGWAQLGAAGPAGFTQTPFRVLIGDRRKGPDGLVAFYTNDDYGQATLAQDLAPAPTAGQPIYAQPGTALPVTCAPEAPPVRLSLLLDPRTGVHVSSGILPAKVIDLPADLVGAALARLQVPFLVAPVLGPRRPDGVPSLPLPTDKPGQWIWTWRSAPGDAPTSAPLTPDTAPARSLSNTMALYEGWLSLRQAGAQSQ
jgi:hypothetical protein